MAQATFALRLVRDADRLGFGDDLDGDGLTDFHCSCNPSPMDAYSVLVD